MNNCIAKTAEIAKSARLVNSKVGNYCSIGENTRFCYSSIRDYSYVSVNSNIFSTNIGKFSSISWNVSINPANHDFHRFTQHPILFARKYGMLSNDKPMYAQYGQVEIGHDVWIGCNAVILGNVKIGDGAIIGSNARVSHDVPPYAIIIGNNNHLKDRFSQEVIYALLRIKWWDAPYEIIRDCIDILSQRPTLDLCDKLYRRIHS